MINDFKEIFSPRFFNLRKRLERGKIVSPRLRKLKENLERVENKKKIVDEFWKAIKENGTPIIEAIERVPHHKLVTFIYKENSDTDKILLACDGLGVIPRRWKFTRLQGTNIYYKSLFYLNKTRINYAIHKASVSLEDITLSSPKDYLRPLEGDPLNKQNFTLLPGYKLAPLELPDAPLQPWIEKKDNVPEGKLEALQLKSAKFNDEFFIKIYLPPNYNPSSEPYGSLFLFDGFFYTNPNRIPTLIKVPVLIIWGDRDTVLPKEEQELLKETIPDAKLVIYPNAGHVFYIEQPDRVSSDIIKFIESL